MSVVHSLSAIFSCFVQIDFRQHSEKVVFGGGYVCLSVGPSDEYLENCLTDLDHILDLAVF